MKFSQLIAFSDVIIMAIMITVIKMLTVIKIIIKIKINEVFSPSRILLRANEISPLQTQVHTGKAE